MNFWVFFVGHFENQIRPASSWPLKCHKKTEKSLSLMGPFSDVTIVMEIGIYHKGGRI